MSSGKGLFDAFTNEEVHSVGRCVLLGKSGLRVSRVSLGSMNFGRNWRAFMGEVSKEEAEKIFNAYCDKGGNFIDTACNYQDGESEEWLGEFIEKRGNRDDLVIATKYSLPQGRGRINRAGNHRKNMFFTIEQSLKRLRTSYVDIYYVHFLDYTVSCEEVMRNLNHLVSLGKVHHLAVSDAPAWWVARCNTIAELRGWARFECYQGKYHFGERDMEHEIIPMCQSLGISVVPWNVLGGGKWTGKYKRSDNAEKKYESNDAVRTWTTVDERDLNIIDVIVQVAKEANIPPSHVPVHWALSKGVIPILGARKAEQLLDNMDAVANYDSADHRLNADQIARLDKITQPAGLFPNNFLGGTDYHSVQWTKPAGIIL